MVTGTFKHTIEEMQELAAAKDGHCLSKEYRGLNKKLTWQCNKDGYVKKDIYGNRWRGV